MRLESIISISKDKNENLFGISKISIILKDYKEIQIQGSKELWKLICEKVKIEGTY